MKKTTAIIRIIPAIKTVTSKSITNISEKALEKTTLASDFLIDIANVCLFIIRFLVASFAPKHEFREFFYQCYKIGYMSLPLISITGTIIGLVLTIQSRPILLDFGAVSLLPGMVTISLIREMGPVTTGLICAGKIASSMGAELGSMKVTEQIEAMEVSSTNPMKFLVVTRVWAAILMIPLLILYADFLGIMGSWLGANISGDVTFYLFFSQAFSYIEFIDLFPAIVKSFFFGAVIGLVGCYKGYNAGRGTESVGIAANSAVVTASLILLIIDVIAVQITDMMM